MIKTIPQAIDDIAVSLGASPSAEIPTVAQALENLYTALGGDRTDLDTLVLPEVIDLVAPLIHSGGGGGGEAIVVHISDEGAMDKKWIEIRNSFPNATYETWQGETGTIMAVIKGGESVFIVADEYSQYITDNENGYPTLSD